MDVFYSIQLLADHVSFGIEPLNFFIYDSVKIFVLLIVIIYVVTFLRSFVSPEKTRKLLTRKFPVVGNILAALIGIVTPFCSCSAVPLFIGFIDSAVPLGATFPYLISSPMVNEVAAVLLLGLFGWQTAGLYILSGVIIAITAGFILGKLKLEPLVEDYVWKIKANQTDLSTRITLKDRLTDAKVYTADLVKKVFPYVLLGVGIGALIHGYAPANFLAKVAGRDNPLAVLIAVAIGVPLYSNAAGTVPIVSSLIGKGLPLGTALAFMMSVTALSLPEMVILRKVLKPKLLAIYIAILTLGIIFTGYFFNLII